MRDAIKPVFEERYREMLGDEYEEFIETILTPQRKSFRVNSIKANNPDEVINTIKGKEVAIEPVPWSKNSYYVIFDEEKRADLGNLYEHFLGKIYVQEATSMLPPELLEIPKDVDSSFSVLDMAAAPGSKTTQVGEKMNNQGILVANELDYSRLGPLKANLERSGLTNVVITNSDGRRIEGEEIFDRVLLDAPCSGSGVIRKSPKTIRMYNPKKLKGITRLQLQLLKRAYGLLKRGGVLTYSTCSMDPEENEFLVQKFLEETEDAILEVAEVNGLERGITLTSFQDKEISKEITEKTLRVWPHKNDTNGFYVAKISKPLRE